MKLSVSNVKVVLRQAIIRLGLKKHLVSPAIVRRVALPYKISFGQVPMYVLVYDSLHAMRGRVKVDIPLSELRLRPEFIAQSDPVVQMCLSNGESYGGVAVSRRTGCLELTALPSLSWLKSFYEQYFGNASGVDVSAVRKVAAEIKGKRTADKVYRYVKDHFEKPGRVFDIGCGYGDQLAIFASKGWDVQGIEPNIMRRLVAEDLYGIKPYEGGVEELGTRSFPGLVPHSFDLVILNQVLEHLSDPQRTLKAARELLKPDGVLFVAVPDLELETIFALHNNFVHVRSYTGAALRAELGLAGFRVQADMAAFGYNIVVARIEDGTDVTAYAAQARQLAQAHIAKFFPREGEDERLIVVTHPIYGNRTLIYRWQGVTPTVPVAPEPLPIVTSGFAGSFLIAADGADL